MCARCFVRLDGSALSLRVDRVELRGVAGVLYFRQGDQEIIIPASEAERLLAAAARLGAWLEAASMARMPAGVTALPRGPGCAMVFGDAPRCDFAAASEAAADRMLDDLARGPRGRR